MATRRRAADRYVDSLLGVSAASASVWLSSLLVEIPRTAANTLALLWPAVLVATVASA